tara:strand:- start:22 stop:213 length:192 start_codon:yes stop_codon:yes gene_type:complete
MPPALLIVLVGVAVTLFYYLIYFNCKSKKKRVILKTDYRTFSNKTKSNKKVRIDESKNEIFII